MSSLPAVQLSVEAHVVGVMDFFGFVNAGGDYLWFFWLFVCLFF